MGNENKMKTVDQCKFYDDFGWYVGIVQLFLGHSINIVLSCFIVLQAQNI